MDANSRTIYVELFPLNTSEEILREAFTNFGQINRIELPHFPPEHPLCRGLPTPKTKGYAFIEFSSKSSVDRACKYFNDLSNLINIQDPSEGEGLTIENNGEPSQKKLKTELVWKSEYKELLPLRVMTKQKFLDLEQKYEEARLKSVIEAAKLLVIPCANLYG